LKDNLLIGRLKKIKNDDFLRFELFVKSPYFHKSENAIHLINLIKPFFPDFNFTKSVISKIEKLSPSKTAHHVLFSRMNDLLDEFELYEIYNKKKFLKKSLIYELELEEKNNIKYYRQLQQLPAETTLSSDELYADFYKEFSSITLCENNWITDKEKIFLHSDHAMKNLLHFFLSKYLLVYANKITHASNMPEVLVESTETKLILNLVKEQINQLPVSVKCVYYVIQLYRNITDDDKAFNLYFEKLKKETFRLQKNEISYEIKYALLQASSACVIKCYTNPAYFQKSFEIVSFLVKEELYFLDQHDLIIQQRFILIVKIALGAGQIEWTKDFIKNEIRWIKKISQTNLYNYALGLVCFNQQEYNEAVKLMVKINLNTPQFIIDYKITLLKMYYELDDHAGFNYQSQTFEKFLMKDKSLNKQHKINLKDSVDFIKLLFRYKKTKKQQELYKKIALKNMDYLVTNYRDKWFAEKLKALNC
jgi:hypothetical protein